jgi:hypothetical protein
VNEWENRAKIPVKDEVSNNESEKWVKLSESVEVRSDNEPAMMDIQAICKYLRVKPELLISFYEVCPLTKPR